MSKLRVGICVVLLGVMVSLAVNHYNENNYTSQIQHYQFLSKPYHIDKIYKSMMGPESTETFTLLDVDPPELIWVVGYDAVMVQEDGKTLTSQEFMCHSNLDFNFEQRTTPLSKTYHPIRRIFTLSQGQFEIHLPIGYGIPMMSNEVLDLQTQVLNLNLNDPELIVRHKVTIDFIRDRDLKTSLKPLFVTGAQGMVLVKGDSPYYGQNKGSHSDLGPGCGLDMPIIANKEAVLKDDFGKEFVGHWVVPKGKSENRTLATQFLDIPYDTRIHYIAVHLHPFAEYMELWDKTEDKLLYRSNVKNSIGKIGLDEVEYYSSSLGIPVFKDHDYEVVTIYNNTSPEEQDAMAVMYMFLHDRVFNPIKR